ncbi:MAG: flavodoxin family protein [Patescibacteria group bacterium]|nr:flavodoxin family protein [Patescibacteria group bacterium]
MNILILYATNSGGTEMAAQMIGQHLSDHTIEIKRVLEQNPDTLNQYDCILFGSPSWDYDGKEGQPHDDFWEFKKKMEGKTLNGKRCAIFGLGDSSYKIFTGAVDVLEQWVNEWKGTLIVPSIRIDKFYYQQAENAQLIEEWSKKLHDALQAG